MPVLCHALAAFCGREARPETRPSPEKAWYAVHTKSRAEFQVRDRLAARGIAVFLPVIERPSQRRNRSVTVTRPLFTCYLFARAERRELLAVSGVAQVSGPFSEADIGEIRSAAAGHAIAGYAEGESVTVARGPFAGVSGVVAGRKGARRLMIRAAVLGRACLVEISAGDVFGNHSHINQRAAA